MPCLSLSSEHQAFVFHFPGVDHMLDNSPLGQEKLEGANYFCSVLITQKCMKVSAGVRGGAGGEENW